jgi:hypothetical protein
MTDEEFEKHLLDDTQSIISRIRGIMFFLAIIALFGTTKVILSLWGWNSIIFQSRVMACDALHWRMYDRAPDLNALRSSFYSDSISKADVGLKLRLDALEHLQYADSIRYVRYVDQLQAIYRQVATSSEGIPLIPALSIPSIDLPIALAVSIFGAGILLWIHVLQLEINAKKWIGYLKTETRGKIHVVAIHAIDSSWLVKTANLPPPILIISLILIVNLVITIVTDISFFSVIYFYDPIISNTLSPTVIAKFIAREITGVATALLFFKLAFSIPKTMSHVRDYLRALSN